MNNLKEWHDEVSQWTDQPHGHIESPFAGTEDAPVLDGSAPLRRLHDSGAGYKYSELLTYLHETVVLQLNYCT